jgi:hypothetical protein
VGAGKLLLAGVEVHLPFPVEQDLHGPPAKATACFPQGHLGRLLASEIFGELVWELLLAERVAVDENDERLAVEALRLFFLTRRRACRTAAPAPAMAMAAAPLDRDQLNPPWSACGESWVAAARVVDVWC